MNIENVKLYYRMVGYTGALMSNDYNFDQSEKKQFGNSKYTVKTICISTEKI